ncbi:hypothetical protein KDW_33200 [Dictyobacter vulcani]|uniref:DNA mismatch repair protein MutS-like N-terminal domain-containing protein n=1 Tax=Dictyobacter vulcani TaxID=2607529 RepID=A0A5J4KHF0_9CHLR|nr:hypothetical protein KDW_33200 [Dictyobacter vulcani]
MLFEEYEKENPVYSPVRAQYLNIKRQNPDAILFFRMGDFYEMFDDDAEIVARELEIALTRRDFGKGQRSPMAGIPHHAADGYIARLVGKGYRVAIAEQTSDPALSKGLVDREVVRIVTPGTVIDPAMLAAKRNNFLASVIVGRDAVGLAYVDITTGEFAVTQFSSTEPDVAAQQEIARVGPAEVLVEANYHRHGSRKRRWLAAVMNEKQVTKVGSNGNPNAEIPTWTKMKRMMWPRWQNYSKGSPDTLRPMIPATSVKMMPAIDCCASSMPHRWKASAAPICPWPFALPVQSWPMYRKPKRACCNS